MDNINNFRQENPEKGTSEELSGLQNWLNTMPDGMRVSYFHSLKHQMHLFERMSNNGDIRTPSSDNTHPIYDSPSYSDRNQASRNISDSRLYLPSTNAKERRLEMLKQLLHMEYLFEHENWGWCVEQLEPLLAVAYQYEFLTAIDQLLRIKLQLVHKGLISGDQLADARVEHLKIQEKVINFHQYEFLRLKVFLLISNMVDQRRYAFQIKGFLNHQLLEGEKNALTARAKWYYYEIKSMIYSSINDFEQAYQTIKEMLLFVKGNTYLLEEDIQNYCAILSNFMNITIGMNKIEEALACIQKMKELPNQYPDLIKQDMIEEMAVRNFAQESLIYVSQGKYEQVLTMIEQLNSHLAISPHTTKHFYQQLSVLNIVTALKELDQNEQALKWLLRLENYQRDEVGLGIQIAGIILRMQIYVDMEDTRGLEKFIQKTKRYFKKYQVKGRFEALFLAMMTLLVRLNDDPKIRQTFYEEYLILFKAMVDKQYKGRDYRHWILKWLEEKVK